jgi:hypothetical protein
VTRIPVVLEDSTDELSPTFIHRNYFPNHASNPAELEWIQPSRQPFVKGTATRDSTRFDLSGNPLTAEESENMETHKGLHHHGDEAGRAGYTIDEVIQLCASTFLPQRTMMLGVLGKLLGRRKVLLDSHGEDIFNEKLLKAAIDVVVGIFCSPERNTGVIREVIGALHASIPANCKRFLSGSGYDDDIATEALIIDATTQKWIKFLPLPVLLERISAFLDQPIRFSNLHPASIDQLIGVLLAIAFSSAKNCDEAALVVPRLVKNFLIKLEWPRPAADRTNGDVRTETSIAMLVLRLLRSCTTASRLSAVNLLNAGAYDVPLKLLYFSPWSEDNAVTSDEQSWAISSIVVDVYEKLARYGLNGTLLSNTLDIWVQLGAWVSRQSFVDIRTEILHLVRHYFALLRVWQISAKDPHSLQQEHDLIWSQISGYGWQDEADHFLHAVWPLLLANDPRPVVWAAAASAMGVLTAWSDGSKINEAKNGIAERRALADGLRDLQPLSLVIKTILQGFSTDNGISNSRAVFSANTLQAISSIEIGPTTEQNLDAERLLKHIAADQGNTKPSRLAQTMNVLSYRLVSMLPQTTPRAFAELALPLIERAQPGEEDHAMQLVDRLLDLTWPSEVVGLIGHRHGLYILRPFLHHAILPDLDQLTTPVVPLSNMFRATATLRQSTRSSDIHEGLPLRSDWLFVAVEQYLRRESSHVFQQLPPAWDASRLEMVRATLALSNLLEGCQTRHQTRSYTILNSMKVFLLEGARDLEGSDEIFRDPAVSQLLQESLAPCLLPAEEPTTVRLDEIATSITPSDTTFFQIYSDFVQLFDAMSLSDMTFSQLLVVPLSQAYPIDYRRLVWSEQSAVIKSVRLETNQILFEGNTLQAYYEPEEEDPDMLFAYLQALAKRWVTKEKQPFLYSIATCHLSAASRRDEKGPLHERLLAGIDRDLTEELKLAIRG